MEVYQNILNLRWIPRRKMTMVHFNAYGPGLANVMNLLLFLNRFPRGPLFTPFVKNGENIVIFKSIATLRTLKSCNFKDFEILTTLKP